MQAELPQAINGWNPQMGLTPEVKAFIDAQVAQGKVGYNGRFPINQNWSVIAVPPGQEENGNFFPGAYTVIENGTDKAAWHPGIQAFEFNATTGQPNRTFGWSNPDRYTGGEKLTIGMLAAMTGGAAAAAMGAGAGAAGAAGGAGGAGAGAGGAAAAGGAGAAEAASAAAAAEAGGAGFGLGSSGTGLTLGGGATGLQAGTGAGLQLASATGGAGLTAGSAGAGAIGGGLGAGFAGGAGSLLGPAALAGTTSLSTGLTLPTATQIAGSAGSAASALGNAGDGGTELPGHEATHDGGGFPNPFTDGGFDWTKLIGPVLAGAGGIAGSNAAKEAADAQLQSSRESNALLEKMFNKQIELSEPFRTAGVNATNRMQELLGLGGDPNAPGYGSEAGKFSEAEPAFQQFTKQAPQWQDFEAAPTFEKYTRQAPEWQDFEAAPKFEKFTKEAPQYKDFTAADMVLDPGYQFRRDQGTKARVNAYAGKGSFLSGAALKGIEQYGQDYASGEFGNAFNRYQQGYANKVNDYNNEYTRYAGERSASLADYARRFGEYQQGYTNRVNDYNNDYSRFTTERGANLDAYNQRFGQYVQGYNNRVNDFNNEYSRFASERGAGQDAYNQRFNRFYLGRNNALNPLQSMAGMGQTSAGTMSGAAGQFGANASANLTDAGNARAAGIVGSTNALTNALGAGYGAYQNSVLANQNNALMNALIRR